jgi:hypothetical protein
LYIFYIEFVQYISSFAYFIHNLTSFLQAEC